MRSPPIREDERANSHGVSKQLNLTPFESGPQERQTRKLVERFGFRAATGAIVAELAFGAGFAR
jgi:hypothetical protein